MTDNLKQPLWYVFSGMGSQWAGMGKDLLNIPLFAAAIARCDGVLAPLGIDIYHIISTDDNTVFDNILNCFVGIAAVQIGLVDILNAIELKPDGMVGHSVGELGCAYADGCFTAEEMVLAAYARGKASLESKVIDEIMAAVGIGFKDMVKRLPTTIDVACHNASDSCTLSGPTDDILDCVKHLKDEKIFAKAVSTGKIAYHSRYIEPVAPKLLEYLYEVVKTPKPRSPRWISSSIPEVDWSTSLAKLSSAEYHTNNLLSPVLFEEACQHIPKDAIVIEIAPHGLLQAILRRSLIGCVNVPLTNRSAPSGVTFLLDALGSLFLHNVNLDVNKLYPPVQYPVSRGTPYLSPLVTWSHSDHMLTEFENILCMMTNINNIELEMSETHEDYNLWLEHRVDGQIVLPASLIVVYTLTKLFLTGPLESEKRTFIFKDTVFSKQAIYKRSSQELMISKQRCNRFGVHLIEDWEDFTAFCTGQMEILNSTPADLLEEKQQITVENGVTLTKEDVLEILARYGYELGPQYHCLKYVTLGDHGFSAKVEWTGNIITFLETLFKIVLLTNIEPAGKFLYTSSFKGLSLFAEEFFNLEKGTVINVHYDSRSNIVSCRGLKVVGLAFSPDPSCKGQPTPLLWARKGLVPLELQFTELLGASLQLVAEMGLCLWQNEHVEISVIQLNMNTESLSLINKAIKEALNILPNIKAKIEVFDLRKAMRALASKRTQNCLVIGSQYEIEQLVGLVGSNVFMLAHVCSLSHNTHRMVPNGSVPIPNRPIGRDGEKKSISSIFDFETKDIFKDSSYNKYILTQSVKADEKFVLLKKQENIAHWRVVLLERDEWLSDVDQLLNGYDNGKPVIVVSRKWGPSEVLPILAQQKYAHRIRCVFLDDSAPDFCLSTPLFYNQLSLGLAVNHLSNTDWKLACSTVVKFDPKICQVDTSGSFTSSDTKLDVNVVALNTIGVTYNPIDTIDKMDIKYLDYCGTKSGCVWMGLAEFDPLANQLTADSTLAWPLPRGWTNEDGASVVAAYALAYHCLHVSVELETGMSVLVQAGDGPVSAACISVALDAGADVYVSVSSQQEHNALLKSFSQLNSAKFILMDSFYQMLERDRPAMNVVINCLGQSDIDLSLKFIANMATYINLRTPDIRERAFLGMGGFLKQLKFQAVSLTSVYHTDSDTKKKIHSLMKNGLEKGVVKPLRRRLFVMEEFHQALSHLTMNGSKEKTLISVNKGQTSNNVLQYNPEECFIIVASGEQLWLDLLEWLTKHGARKFLVAIVNDHRTYNDCCRLRKLDKVPNFHVTSHSASYLNSSVGALEFLNEATNIGPISSVFCVTMDENCSYVANLDAASRLLVPQPHQFVCLLGGSWSVCESRARLGLPACLIQSKLHLSKPHSVLKYLPSILTNHASARQFFSVSEAFETAQDKDYNVTQGPQSLLPNSITDVLSMADDISDRPILHEEVTRSPAHRHVSYCLLPVFVIPGTCSSQLKGFVSNLMHLTYSVSLPFRQTSVEATAEAILQEVLRIQKQGPYNLVGESWSGGLALHVGLLLEARGERVELFLLDAAPAHSQHCARMLYDTDKRSLNINLLTTTLNVDSQIERQLQQCDKWQEQLTTCLQLLVASSEISSDKTEALSKALTALSSQLTAVLQYKPSQDLFKGEVHLIRPKGASVVEFCDLFLQYCQRKPRVYIVSEENHEAMLNSPECARIVNENLLYSWELF